MGRGLLADREGGRIYQSILLSLFKLVSLILIGAVLRGWISVLRCFKLKTVNLYTFFSSNIYDYLRGAINVCPRAPMTLITALILIIVYNKIRYIQKNVYDFGYPIGDRKVNSSFSKYYVQNFSTV